MTKNRRPTLKGRATTFIHLKERKTILVRGTKTILAELHRLWFL